MKTLFIANCLAYVMLGLWLLSVSQVPAECGMLMFLVGVFGSLWAAHEDSEGR